jgi:hypothetical protein
MRHKFSLISGLVALVTVIVNGCGALPTQHSHEPAQPAIDRDSTEATVIGGYLDVCLRVARGTPAEQAEILSNANNDYTAAATPSRELRYAMLLSTPGHAGYDPVGAQRLLREVLANPETLLPAERALAFLQLQQVERQQSLQADVRRLQIGTERATNDRIAQLSKRLTTESEENTRLKKALVDAQAKLDAIANIEKSSNNGRTTQPEGRKP